MLKGSTALFDSFPLFLAPTCFEDGVSFLHLLLRYYPHRTKQLDGRCVNHTALQKKEIIAE